MGWPDEVENWRPVRRTTRRADRLGENVNVDGWWLPLVISVLVTPFALLIGLASAGFGHGDYVWATILFPYTILTPHILGFGAFFLAIVQFPLYGWLLSNSIRRGRLAITIGIIVAAHTLAVLAAFSAHAVS